MIQRLREVKKWGNSHVVVLTSTDMNDLQLREGDKVDVSDLIKTKTKGGKKK